VLQGSSSLGFVCWKLGGRVLAFVDPVMHCALVIVISQYGYCEEWRNIIINNIIITVARQAISLQTMRKMQNIYAQKTLPHCNIAWCNVILNYYARVKAKCIIDVLDVQINVYKRDTKYLNVSTDIQHRTIRINTATTCCLKAFVETL
jgi:hypothetical protein